MPSLTSRLTRFAQRSADRPAYPALIGSIAAVDYLLPGAPTNALLVASVLPRPARWRVLGVSFAIGDAIGAMGLAALIGFAGDPIIAWIQGGEAADLWARIAGFVDVYGLLTLAALSISPLPARIATAVLGMLGTPVLLIGGIVLAGRLVAYPAVAYLAARAPVALRRLPLARTWLSGNDVTHSL
ncbi:MAG: hypothetical protein AAFQ43_04315 [Bacteroidota bacterium]